MRLFGRALGFLSHGWLLALQLDELVEDQCGPAPDGELITLGVLLGADGLPEAPEQLREHVPHAGDAFRGIHHPGQLTRSLRRGLVVHEPQKLKGAHHQVTQGLGVRGAAQQVQSHRHHVRVIRMVQHEGAEDLGGLAPHDHRGVVHPPADCLVKAEQHRARRSLRAFHAQELGSGLARVALRKAAFQDAAQQVQRHLAHPGGLVPKPHLHRLFHGPQS
mmetsp:Transcript_33645/g.80708  ORF Transcript_33645/g.80708 Transcript_33645/m.80708 type:complete len:219 (+) Transcript_33645:607-1263(+)